MLPSAIILDDLSRSPYIIDVIVNLVYDTFLLPAHDRISWFNLVPFYLLNKNENNVIINNCNKVKACEG